MISTEKGLGGIAANDIDYDLNFSKNEDDI